MRMKKQAKFMCLKIFILYIFAILLSACGQDNKNQESNSEDSLERAVHSAILSNNKCVSEDNEDSFGCESHVILKTEKTNEDSEQVINKVTVYSMVLYEEYKLDNNSLVTVSGSHVPTIMTFHTNSDEDYELKEYWTPGMAQDYYSVIKEMFPEDIYQEALDTPKYIKKQKKSCEIGRAHV